MFLMILLLSMVVSLDGFSAALAYGAKHVRISPLALLIIGSSSALIMFTAMQFGQLAAGWLQPELGRYIGAGILIALGLYLLLQHGASISASQDSARKPKAIHTKAIAQIRVRALGIVIQILHDPLVADRDHSGVISWQESLLLGIALALDAVGAGIGAAMAGMPALQTAITIGVVKLLALISGWELGYRVRGMLDHRVLSRMPGVLLIFLGLLNIL